MPGEFDEFYLSCTAGLLNWISYIRDNVQDLIAGERSKITQFRLQGIGNLLYQDITPLAGGGEKAVVEASCFKLLELYEGKKEDLTDETKAQAQMLRSALETAHATYRDIMDCWETTFGLHRSSRDWNAASGANTLLRQTTGPTPIVWLTLHLKLGQLRAMGTSCRRPLKFHQDLPYGARAKTA